jgi:putative ABC transport system substrate-binding protein
MRRRDFMALFGGAAAGWPLVAHAQQKSPTRTIGVIMGVTESDPDSQTRIAAFRAGFEELGWKDGQNIRIEYRWTAGRTEFVDQYCKEIVALAPSVILANSTPVVATLQNLTTSIPIVCALVTDPVGLGFVKSLSHPGGNITGFLFVDPELLSKWTELLKGSTPGLERAGVLYNPATAPFYRSFLSEIAAAQPPAQLDLTPIPVGTAEELEKAIVAFGQTPGGGLIVGPDSFNIVHIERIAQLAANSRLSAVSVYRPFAVAGGLMSYGPDTAEIFRRSAAYVDRILKGANPAELPVQQPTKFEFVINSKAAKALGVTLPATMLALADEVVE